VSVTVTVFTSPLEVVGFAAAAGVGLEVVWGWYLGVVKPLEGFEPGACWISFPCSAIRADGSFRNSSRSLGTILDLTRSLTGCFSFDSE